MSSNSSHGFVGRFGSGVVFGEVVVWSSSIPLGEDELDVGQLAPLFGRAGTTACRAGSTSPSLGRPAQRSRICRVGLKLSP